MEPAVPAVDPGLPHSGEVLIISRAASVQFTTSFFFRVIRVLPWDTYDGWCWLDGYVLNTARDAVERRRLFVQIRGLHRSDQADAVPRCRPARGPAKKRDRYTADQRPARQEEPR
ncbi:hypothetical protein ACWKSP_29205 [Micromonosporaceae bacterium Da 78-11]